ncbi:endothelin-converting enzyme 1-like, partial [Asbolus verrucosus]
MDRSVDPCTDFYQYSCGGWMKSNPVPDWTATWDRLALLRESLMQSMRQLLERGDEINNGNYTELRGIRKARALYRTCMNTVALEAKGLAPIRDILQAVGLSPIPPNNYANEHFDWLFTIARTRRLLGISMLLGMNVAEDVRNSSTNKIVIEQVSPGFGDRYLLQAEKFSAEIKNYKKYITQMLRAYTNFTGAEYFAEDIVNFSTQIAKVMTPSETRRSPSHLFHEVNLIELANGPGVDNESWRFVNWTRYMNTVFNDTTVVLHPQKDTAILLDLPYLQKLSKLIKKSNKLVLERFLWWSVFSTVAPLTLAKFRSLGFEFSQQLLGLQSKTPRWKSCTSNVNANFGLALSYLYIRSHFNKNHRDQALEMLEDIRKAFEDAVHDLDWMDETTREKTLTKLHAIRAFVGYPGWIMNATQLDTHYKKAHVIEGNLFDTYLNLTNAAVRRNLQSIRKKPDRNRWVASATTVNAFYSATLNSVTFPAGILKPPFYGNGIEAIDYGAIGAIMGHEITHGFDDQGRRYDEHGNLKQWWSAATLNHYHQKVQCIINQYNNYTMPDLGDAFHIWCGNSTLGALKSKLVDGVHSPNRIRVLGTLSNSKEFAKAWGCPSDTPMNPENK